MDARQVGIAVVELGGGRRHADDAIDTSVGLSDFVDVGRHIHRGEPLCLVHAASEADADAAIALIRRAVRIEEEAPSGTPAILERVAL
jgi:thymidine phosphorylase